MLLGKVNLNDSYHIDWFIYMNFTRGGHPLKCCQHHNNYGWFMGNRGRSICSSWHLGHWAGWVL